MANITVNTNPEYDQILLAMTREMMGPVQDGEETRQATPQEAIAFWQGRFTQSIMFFGKKYYRAQQVAELEDAPDITA